jgi:hypothetical protein
VSKYKWSKQKLNGRPAVSLYRVGPKRIAILYQGFDGDLRISTDAFSGLTCKSDRISVIKLTETDWDRVQIDFLNIVKEIEGA